MRRTVGAGSEELAIAAAIGRVCLVANILCGEEEMVVKIELK